jgi:hypothetical protein
MSVPESNERDIRSLRNWAQGTASLARQETSYLERRDDLVNLTGSADDAITRMEVKVEDCAFWLKTRLGRVRIKPVIHPSPNQPRFTNVRQSITVCPPNTRKTPAHNHHRRAHLPSRPTPPQTQPHPDHLARHVDSASTGPGIVQHHESCRPPGDGRPIRRLLPLGRLTLHECEDRGAFCGWSEVREFDPFSLLEDVFGGNAFS